MAEETNNNYSNAIWPPPPPFYKQFTSRNLERLRELKEARSSTTEGNGTEQASNLLDLPPELRYLVPPEPPADGLYRSFGEEHTIHDYLRTLPQQGVQQLYPESAPPSADATQWTLDRAFYLKKMVRSIILSFLELVGILSINPELHPQKIEQIKTLFLNAHHLINEYRPHQARESLIMMMEEQVERKRSEIEGVKKMKEKVEQMLADLGREEDGAMTVDVGGPKQLSTAEAWKEEQRAIWAALDGELAI